MDGILLVDKPIEWTSFDAVNRVRSIVQNSGLADSSKKRFPVGHCGTLDPLASGLLVLLLGDYTKKAAMLTMLDKIYISSAKLGQTSTTGDDEGEKTIVSGSIPGRNELDMAIKNFEGDIEQIPPIYSAIKINGKRAYQLARSGVTVEMKPRKSHIEYIKLLKYDYPLFKIETKVSSGTYIRSLVEDIGASLGTGAYITDLRRTKVGRYDVSDAVKMPNLSAETVYNHLLKLD